MRTRDRQSQAQPLADVPSDPASRVGEPSPTHERADDLLRAADDAINKALSRDATRFLADSRQQGGQ
jgi:hypothetical protein